MNEPAFPQALENSRAAQGMTLRDYFAAKAMQALIVNPEQAQARGKSVAETAYAAADAMLKARQA